MTIAMGWHRSAWGYKGIAFTVILSAPDVLNRPNIKMQKSGAVVAVRAGTPARF
jgi:hypothetical protein